MLELVLSLIRLEHDLYAPVFAANSQLVSRGQVYLLGVI